MRHYPYQITSREEYEQAYLASTTQPEIFWSEVAQHFQWQKPWKKVLEWNFEQPEVRWFEGGQLNITENCLDRHLTEFGERAAIIWEPNDPQEEGRTLTYNELYEEVCLFAQVLRNNGIQKGDRVCIYMGMTPELAIATLACARIGAIHSIIFGGFSAQAIADRVQDAMAQYVITSDGAYRGAKDIPLKSVVDEALEGMDITKVIVNKRTNQHVVMHPERDVWWEDQVEQVIQKGNYHTAATAMEAEDILFILYTSGSTGKPKGVVHTTAGYMVWTNYTFVNVFQYQPGQVHFCTADIGWITGHSYIIYGPLSAGATTLMFEGVPTWPDAGRFWEIVEKYQVNILYTAPTAIRSLMGFGTTPIKGKNLTSLKVLGSVGEPINEEAWHWYHRQIGGEQCPVVDTWWQTETGGILISNLAGITPHKPSYATLPLPGIQPSLVDENGNEIEGNDVSGNLCIKFPWPGMIRSTYGDHERCKNTYFSVYQNTYFTGDGCYRDHEGNYRITGRVDDVLNVSGHRIGTAEVENAINSHPGVIESAVVGFPHDIKGQGIYAYVICETITDDVTDVQKAILHTVSKVIGPIAKPDYIQIVPGLPKTRSGKIMRRILRKIAEGDTSNLGDTTTLLDPSLVDTIINGAVKK
jgi:acetyl-CoA synthetase